MKFITMRVSEATHKAVKEQARLTGVKLWFALERSAQDRLFRLRQANGKAAGK